MQLNDTELLWTKAYINDEGVDGPDGGKPLAEVMGEIAYVASFIGWFGVIPTGRNPHQGSNIISHNQGN